MDIPAQINQLLGASGALWLAALVGQFVVMICEGARPKPTFGEQAEETRGLGWLVVVLSLFTPLLLLAHAFITTSGALAAGVLVIAVAIVGASIIGWIIGAAAPDIGRTLYRVSPWLAAGVFVLTLFVAWRSVLILFDSLGQRLGG